MTLLKKNDIGQLIWLSQLINFKDKNFHITIEIFETERCPFKCNLMQLDSIFVKNHSILERKSIHNTVNRKIMSTKK